MSNPALVLAPEVLAHAIIREASRFIGLREVKPNTDWDNPSTPGPDTALARELRALMRPSPWEEGWAYCAAFAEGVVAAALLRLVPPAETARFRAVMGPHCVTAAGAFRARGLLTQSPQPGSIWLARHGTTSNGHAGIVCTTKGTKMATIEANTSLDPSTPAKEREGDWITNRLRGTQLNGSLRTLGFVTPDAILSLCGGRN